MKNLDLTTGAISVADLKAGDVIESGAFSRVRVVSAVIKDDRLKITGVLETTDGETINNFDITVVADGSALEMSLDDTLPQITTTTEGTKSLGPTTPIPRPRAGRVEIHKTLGTISSSAVGVQDPSSSAVASAA